MDKKEIKNTRIKLKKTQEQMAQLIGVTFATWNRWENGHHKPHKIFIEKIKSLVTNEI